MPTAELPFGTIEYRTFGPDEPSAPTAVFVHGFLVDGHLWDGVAERLAAEGVRSIVPDWPLGSHRVPAANGADLSPSAVAATIPTLLERLGLDRVALVGNDTGGALCQLALRADASRVGSLVLTNCDAFENFPPKFFVPLFRIARHPAVTKVMLTQTRLRAIRHSPMGYGLLLRTPLPAALTASWIRPALADRRIRRDIATFASGLRGDELIDSAEWLQEFDGPVRLVWGSRDRCFTIETARRLAAAFPNATLVEVPDASTFVSVDEPGPVADAIVDVLRRP